MRKQFTPQVIQRNLQQRRFFWRILFSLIVVAALAVVIVSSLLYTSFTGTMLRQLQQNNAMLFQRSAVVCQQLYKQSRMLLVQASNDPQFIEAMTETEDAIDLWRLSQRMRRQLDTSLLVYSLVVYNGKTDEIHSTDAPSAKLTEWYDRGLQRLIVQSVRGPLYRFVPRWVAPEWYQPNTLSLPVLTMVSSDTTTPSWEVPGALAINIRESDFRSLIQPLPTQGQNQFFIVDDQGLVISSSDSSLFAKNVSALPYVQHVLGDEEPTGSFREWLNNHDCLVEYASLTDLDWKIVSVTDYSLVTDQAKGIRNIVIGVSCTVILFCLLIAWLLAQRTYSPLQRLLTKLQILIPIPLPGSAQPNDELSAVSSAVEQAIARTRELESQQQSRLVSVRQWEALTGHLLLTLQEWVDLKLWYPEYHGVVFCVRITGPEPPAETQILKSSAIDRITAMLGRRGLVTPVFTPWNEVFVVFSFTSTLDPSDVVQTAGNELEHLFSSEPDLFRHCVIGVGNPTSSPDLLVTSGHQAKEATAFVFFHGFGSVLHFSPLDLDERSVIPYPVELEKNLIDALHLGKIDSMEHSIDELSCLLTTTHPSEAKLLLNQFATYVARSLAPFEASRTGLQTEFRQQIQVISTAETLEEAQDVLLSALLVVCSRLQEKVFRRSSGLVEQAFVVIQTHHHELDFSPDRLADAIGVPSRQLRQLFREAGQPSPHECIQEARYATAAQLLLNTTYPINEVCTRAGFVNFPHFSTAFKRRFGLPPSQYREEVPLQDFGSSGQSAV